MPEHSLRINLTSRTTRGRADAPRENRPAQASTTALRFQAAHYPLKGPVKHEVRKLVAANPATSLAGLDGSWRYQYGPSHRVFQHQPTLSSLTFGTFAARIFL